MLNMKGFLYVLLMGLFLSACGLITRSAPENYPILPAPTILQTVNPPTSTTTQPPTVQPAPSSTAVGAQIRLSPDSGLPGETVRIDGYLPGGLSQTDLESRDYQTDASICWNGCQIGLRQEGLEVNWSRTEPGHFSLQFTVPPISWLAVDGFHPLDAGDYSVDLINLDPSKYGCGSPGNCSVMPVATATFHLTQSATNPPCTNQNCGILTASPDKAAPGEEIQVKGWAPLLEIIGQPSGYYLVLITPKSAASQNWIYLAQQQDEVVRQEMDGSLIASFQVPQYGNEGSALDAGSYTLALLAGGLMTEKNSPPIMVAPTPFEITPAIAWTQIQHSAPLWVQPSAELMALVLEPDPVHMNRLAFCAIGEIKLSQDAGRSWTSIPTEGITLQSPDSSLRFLEQRPTCTSVTLDASHPDSLYAVFSLVTKDGPPPVYYAGYFTMDLGKTWQIVPIPAIKINQHWVSDSFGGFWTDGKIVQAQYYEESGSPNLSYLRLAKQTADGGATWNPAPLNCPIEGPCLRWATTPGMVGGMGSDLGQGVIASPDGGRTWQAAGQAVDLRQIGPRELVALSSKDAILISGKERYPLRYTSDGGRIWHPLSLPDLPGGSAGRPEGYPGLQMLPDGSLLSLDSYTGKWMILSPTAQEWCAIQFTDPEKPPVLFQIIGNRVVWISQSYQVRSVSINQFVCQP